MKLRPPSTLMYSRKCNADSHFQQKVTEHSDMSEEALHRTLLWMKTPGLRELPPQKCISCSCTNIFYNQQDERNNNPQQQESQHVLDSNQQKEKLATDTNSAAYNILLHWVNSCISPAPQVFDLSQSMRTGVVLIQLLEALTGKTITRTQNQTSKSMIMLDNVVEAFKFMNQEGFVNNICTIKGNILHWILPPYIILERMKCSWFKWIDVFCGDEEKMVELLLELKMWAKDKLNIGHAPLSKDNHLY